MLPVAIVRQAIKKYFQIDKYLLARVANELALLVDDAAELTIQRIEGKIIAEQRHTRTNYIATLQQANGTYYNGYRKQVQEQINTELRTKLIRK